MGDHEIKVPDFKKGAPPRLGIDLTLCDKDWWPDACNQRIEFTARIYAFDKDQNQWVYPGEKRKITFSFKDVSKEKGVCMNYPRNGNSNPDLFFPEDLKDFDLEDDDTSGSSCPTEIVAADDNPAHSHHYKKATTKEAVTETKVVVRCEDFGAFGTLQASASDCETILPREKDAEPTQTSGPNDVKIPRDDNGNFIADSAPQDDDGAPADSDNDAKPAGDGLGDGLTNYEEYRGFIVSEKGVKKHLRTDINRKDVFIYIKGLKKIGYFPKTGLAYHFIPGPSFYNGNSTDGMKPPDPGTQIINFNRGKKGDGRTGGAQHGIRLVREALLGPLGRACGVGPGTPKDTNRVAIDHGACTGAGMPANELPCTVAHELGHAVNIWHHGQLPAHNHGGIDTDPTGGLTSGNVNCVMRYDNYLTQWCHPSTPPPPPCCTAHAIPALPNDTVGTTYCSKRDGTGVNNPGPGHPRNDASVGRCRSHIKVKDW